MIPEPPRNGGSLHRPVLLRETLALLAPERGATGVDCTVGMGGHSRALLESVGPSGRVLGLERDAESLVRATRELEEFRGCFLPVHADYRDLRSVLAARDISSIDFLLADLGFSSFQMDSPARGFSFSSDGPLDMRMDRSSGPTAADLLSEMGLRSPFDLLGLYQGIPLDQRGYFYGNVLPDKITLYQRAIESASRTEEEVKERIQETVIHEVGHYFGLSDEQLRELEHEGRKRRKQSVR